jgi:hypothetical protein
MLENNKNANQKDIEHYIYLYKMIEILDHKEKQLTIKAQ